MSVAVRNGVARCHARHREGAFPLLPNVGGTAAAYFDASRPDRAKSRRFGNNSSRSPEGIGRLSQERPECNRPTAGHCSRNGDVKMDQRDQELLDKQLRRLDLSPAKRRRNGVGDPRSISRRHDPRRLCVCVQKRAVLEIAIRTMRRLRSSAFGTVRYQTRSTRQDLADEARCIAAPTRPRL